MRMASGGGNRLDIYDHVVLGNYSVDRKGEYWNDDRNRLFFVRPDDKPNFDLTDGLDRFVNVPKQGKEPESIEYTLEWMKTHQNILRDNGVIGHGRRLVVDIVTRRGVLADLLRAAYDVKPLDIFVTLYRGTMYIERKKPDTPQEHKFAFNGHKFKQYVTRGEGKEHNTSLPVNANEAYYSVIKAKCGENTILFSSDVQAERQESKSSPPGNYIAVKTRKAGPNLAWFKKLQWWSQCSLTGIPLVVCGCRDDNSHVVKEIEYYRTGELVTYDESAFTWKPEICIKKMTSLIQNIRDKVKDDDSRSVYHLVLEEVEKGRGQSHRLNNRTFVVKGKLASDYTIVKDWFIEAVM